MLKIWSGDKVQTLNRVVLPRLKNGNIEYEMVGIGDDLPFTTEGDLVFAMGTKAYDVLRDKGIVAKNRTVSSLRLPNIIDLPSGAKLVLTYSGAMIDREYEKYVDIMVDLGTAIRYEHTKSFKPVLGNYKYVDNFSEACNWIKKRYDETGKKVDIALDTETLGLNYLDPKAWIISIQLTYKAGQADMVYFPTQADEVKGLAAWTPLAEQLQWLMNSEMINTCGANFKYDQHWFWERGKIECTNLKFDTMLVGSLLDENRGNSLNLHTKWYIPLLGGYDDFLNKKYDKGRMDLIPKADLLDYAGGDTDACYQVRQKMRQELLKDKQLTKFYVNIIHPAARAYTKVERTGMCLDIPYYLELEDEIETEIAKLEKRAFRVIGGSLCAKYSDNLRLSRSVLIKDFMFSSAGLNLKPRMLTEKTKEPSTSVDHILMFSDNPKAKEFMDIYKEWLSATKTLSTYVCKRDSDGNVISGFLSHMRADARFHPTYFLFNGGEDDGGTNCMPAGELVLTNRGYLPIEKLKVGTVVLSHTGTPRKVIDTVNNGVKQILRVTLVNGLTLRTTPNHEYLTTSGWIKAGSLKIGDVVYTHNDYERWCLIKDWEDFEVSSWGRIRNVKTGNVLAQQPKGKWGHLKVTLYRNGSQVRGDDKVDFTVHRLVANAFILKTGIEVRHLNGLAWDNGVHNLAWGSHQENVTDAVNHGSMWRRKNNQAKLTQESVDLIRNTPRATIKGGKTNKQWADELDVSERMVRRIRADERWESHKIQGKKLIDFRTSVIDSIEIENSVETFGLTVEEDHSHVTGGIVTHNTGRVSARDPAIQTVPKHTIWAKKLRKAFIAPPGMVIMSNDYSQGELKIAACLANEETMIAAYRDGIDLHAVTASRLAGYEWDEFNALKITNPDLYDSIRQLGKAGNFGLIYGMGAGGFQAYAGLNYGVDMSMEEAKKNRDGFFELYTGLPAWHTKYKTMAKNWGQVRSPLGRVRHLPLINSYDNEMRSKAERQSVNAPVQATLSDFSLWATAIMHDKGYFEESPVVAMVHDQLISYVPEDWLLYAERSKEIMENLPIHEMGWKPQLKFTVDCEIGINLGEMKKIKL